MHPIIQNILAIVSGILIGSTVNMGIITISGSIIAPPEGIDNTTMEGLKTSMHLFEPKHFLMPFLAHAIGTLAGAFVVALIATEQKLKFALGIGLFFMLGGIANVIMLPSPLWFTALDLGAAYIPMAYIAGKLANKY